MSDIVIYTAITNNCDTLKKPPIELENGTDFVAFLDCDQLVTPWQVRKAHSEFTDPCRNAKRHKILPHIYFPDKTYSLWIDGSVKFNFNFPIEQLIHKYLKDCDLAVFKHPERQCIYEEADACIGLSKDDPEIIRHQMACYKDEGYPPNNGLAECAILLRRHTEKVRQFNEAWYLEIKNNSRRDQLSFNYVAHKVGLKFCYFQGSLRNKPDDLWHIQPHSAEERIRQAEERVRQAEERARQAEERVREVELVQMNRLLRRRSRAERFALSFSILTFVWILGVVVLIFGDEELRPAFRIFWQLWPAALILTCCFGVCWLWRSSLRRKIKKMESQNTA